MVYRGPSQGCRACRERHMKCDRARPGCLNCAKTQQQCPGYKDYFDVMWKDQNGVIPEKSRRQRATRVRKARRKADQVVLAPSVSPRLLPDTEAECISFFFNYYVDVTTDREAQVGYLELLSPLHGKVRPGSPLSLATSALATNITFAAFGRSLDSELPCALFSKALTMTQSAINDPVQSRTDETLVTVLLLGACDIIGRTARSQLPSGIHKNGAFALVKHRGALNFESELSRQLLIAVRHHTIRMALWTNEKIPADPTVWGDVGTMPESSATMLDTHAAELANLNVRLDRLAKSTASPPPIGPVCTDTRLTPPPFKSSNDSNEHQSVLIAAADLDARLAKWPLSVPPSWHPIGVPILSCVDPSIRAVGLYSASCDIYPSVSIVGLWNWYRTLRIATIKIIVTCQKALMQEEGRETPRYSSHTQVEIVQRLVDEFCASVPFHLGNRSGPILSYELEKVTYPCLPPSSPNLSHGPQCATATSTAEHKRAAAFSGAWFVLDPLRGILKATAPTGSGAFTPNIGNGDQEQTLLPLRKGQREWLLEQLIRVSNMNLYGRAQSSSSSTPSLALSTKSLSTPSRSLPSSAVVSSSAASSASSASLESTWPQFQASVPAAEAGCGAVVSNQPSFAPALSKSPMKC